MPGIRGNGLAPASTRAIELGAGVSLIDNVATWTGEFVYALGDYVDIVDGTAETTITMGTGVGLVGTVATWSGEFIYTLGTNVINSAGVATYNGPKDGWRTVVFADATATIENTKVSGTPTQDVDGWYTISMLNNAGAADDYPSRMPGWIFDLKDAYDNVVTGPFTSQWIFTGIIEVDNTALPTGTAKMNLYMGIFNASGDPTSGSCDNGGAFGWRLDGTTTRVLVSQRSVETTDSTSANEFKVVGTLMLHKGVAHIMCTSCDSGGAASTGQAIDTRTSYGTNSGFKLWIGIGCASVSNTPAGPHAVKCRFRYNLIPVSVP